VSDQLLFLLELIEAMDAPDPRPTIAVALRRIQMLGACRESRDGVLQSRAFVAELARAWGVVFEVARDGRRVGLLEPIGGPETNSLQEIFPGHYTIKLLTGLLIWEGELAPKDVLLRDAYRDGEWLAAADTGPPATARRGPGLLDGRFTMEFLPGEDAGAMRITPNG